MAFIDKRTTKNGTPRYRVGYTENGRQRFTPTLPSGEGAAEMKHLIETIGPDAALAILKTRTAHAGAKTVAKTLNEYLDSLATHATPGTVDDYRSMVARTWGPRLGPIPLTALTRDNVVDWVGWQRTQETARSSRARARIAAHNDTCPPGAELDPPKPVYYSVKSIKNAHTVLSQMLAWAAERHKDVTNVARGIKFPTDETDTEQEIFTQTEFAQFYAAMAGHYKPFVAFLIDSGARINEATALQVRDLDLDAGAARIRRAWKKGERSSRYLGAPKSRRGNRTVSLAPATVDVLRPLVEGRAADEFVFTTPTGKVISDNNFRARQWARALREAGIGKRLGPHSLRHTSASWQLMDGVPPQVVQHRLGHESLDTTSRTYAHLLIDAQAPAVSVMGRALAAAHRPEIER